MAMRRSLIAIAALCATLSGCASMALKSRAELVALDQTTCTDYGFRQGTDAYAQCMFQLDQLRIADTRDRRRAFGAAMRRLASDLNPPTVTCNTTASVYGSFGNSTTTCR